MAPIFFIHIQYFDSNLQVGWDLLLLYISCDDVIHNDQFTFLLEHK